MYQYLMSTCEETLDGDDEQVTLYSGLPSFVTLMAIIHFVPFHIGSSDTSGGCD